MTGKKYSLLIFTIYLIFSFNSYGQGMGGKNGRIEDDFKFLPIPYINYSRSIGFQIGALPMAQFNPVRKDTLSPSSLAGLFGMYSTNKTYFFMGFAKLYFDSDNWRFTTAGGTGSVNFQFYLDNPVDSWIPYNTKMDFFYIEAQRKIYKKIYFGFSYIYIMDYRTNIYYPRDGFHNNLKYFTYPEFMGNEVESNKIEIDHNQYFPVRDEQDVLAARAYVGLGLGDLSFNQQFIVGRRDDIRGYSQGEFRGNYMIAVQGEYRWNLNDSKFGFVGFLGVATVFESINEDDNGRPLPGVGVGIRFTVSEETHLNVGIF